MNRVRLVMLACAMAALSGLALAQAQHKPPSFVVPPPPPLRGPVVPDASAPAPTTPAPVDPLLDPELTPPPDSAARIGGLADEPTGGAICRQACAQTYYFCLSNDQSGSCPTRWTRCQLACPSNSSRQ